MTTAIPLDDDGRVWLYSSDEALAAIDHQLPYMVLHRWTRDGHVSPTQPAQGTGSRVGYSPHDVDALRAIARVRADLDTIGLPCTPPVVRELWDQFDVADTATITAGTVTIRVHIDQQTQEQTNHE